jgi:hypothetical protein
LLAHEAVEIIRIEVGRQDLDGDRSVQDRLDAPIDDAEAAVTDFGDIVESRAAEFCWDVRSQTPLCRMRIDVGRRRSPSSIVTITPQTPAEGPNPSPAHMSMPPLTLQTWPVM